MNKLFKYLNYAIKFVFFRVNKTKNTKSFFNINYNVLDFYLKT